MSRKPVERLQERSHTERLSMADMKFSCPHCGQHISCDDAWAGHQIPCPACQGNLMVPHLQPPSTATANAPGPPTSQAPESSRARLSAGATQVTRPTASRPIPQRQVVPRPPKTGNPVLRFTVMGVVLLAAAWAAFRYVPALLSGAHDLGGSLPAASAPAPAGGGGPLGEVNAAMDVSDALDGSSQARARPGAARPPVPARPPAAAQPPTAVQPRVAAQPPTTRNTNTTAYSLTRRVSQPR